MGAGRGNGKNQEGRQIFPCGLLRNNIPETKSHYENYPSDGTFKYTFAFGCIASICSSKQQPHVLCCKYLLLVGYSLEVLFSHPLLPNQKHLIGPSQAKGQAHGLRWASQMFPPEMCILSSKTERLRMLQLQSAQQKSPI